MKSLFEQLGSTYREENGYLIPNLTLPDEEQVEIGLWGQQHLRYIKQHHKVRYVNLLTSGKEESPSQRRQKSPLSKPWTRFLIYIT